MHAEFVISQRVEVLVCGAGHVRCPLGSRVLILSGTQARKAARGQSLTAISQDPAPRRVHADACLLSRVGASRKLYRGKKMGIDVANALAEKLVVIDKIPDLCVVGNDRLGQVEQGIQHQGPLAQMAQCKFAQNKRVTQDQSSL